MYERMLFLSIPLILYTTLFFLFFKNEIFAVMVKRKKKKKIMKELVVEKAKIINENYLYYITGMLKNISNETHFSVLVAFDLFDKKGKMVGNAMTVANHIEAGNVWHFKAFAPAEDIKKFKLTEISVANKNETLKKTVC